jgi:hypothetical protein
MIATRLTGDESSRGTDGAGRWGEKIMRITRSVVGVSAAVAKHNTVGCEAWKLTSSRIDIL